MRLIHKYRFYHQESRMMTVLFFNLDVHNFDRVTTAGIQLIISNVQSAIYRYEGSLNKFICDDKGATAIAVFGLPSI